MFACGRPVYLKNILKHLPFFMRIQLKKKEIKKEMRIQTDQKFKHNEIKKLNKKYNVHIFSSHVYKGKAFAAEKKIKEFKNIFFKTKGQDKRLGRRIRPSKIIETATSNLNKIKRVKYGIAAEKNRVKKY